MASTPNPLMNQVSPSTAQPSPQDQYGPNLENLPEELWRELWNVLMEMEREDVMPRLREIRAVTQRRLFFKGDQYWWWNDTQQVWMGANQTGTVMPMDSGQQQPTFQHVTNIYQATGVSLMTVLSQNSIPARFWPQSARDPRDVNTAKQATRIVDLIHRNNDMQNKADDATYFMWNDGFVGAWVRYESDGERFGWDDQPVTAPQDITLSDAGVTCPACGYSEMGVGEDASPTCPECGEPLQPSPPQTASVDMPTGEVQQIPKGQECIDLYGALNLKRSMVADKQEDFEYLELVTDLQKSRAKSMFPHVADAIGSAGAGFATSNPTEGFEKMARTLLYMGPGQLVGMYYDKLGTLRRVWIRPCAFERIVDETRKSQLLQLFPQGVCATFYGSVYCGAKPECMDDAWETMQSMPGEGGFRESLGSAVLPLQQQYNDCSNMIFEQGMYGTPQGFIDKDIIDAEAYTEQGAMPGNVTFTKSGMGANGNLNNRIMFTQAIEPSQALIEFRGELLGPILQFISGNFPALFGGDTGSNDTASGIAQQRNQALGRIGRSWRRLQVMWANLDAKAVRCFANNRTQDVETAILGDGGDYQSDWIRLEDLQGKFVAYPELDQQYPVLQSEVAAKLDALAQTQNPAILSVMMDPDNMEFFFQREGLVDVVIPGDDQRKKTYKAIDILITQQPQPIMDAMGQTDFIPSIQPDPLVDRLDIAHDTARKWLLSDAGIAAQTDNPPGYLNVRAYMMACDQQAKQIAFRQAVAAQGLTGTGPAADLGGAEDIPSPGQPGGEGNSPNSGSPSSQPA